MLYFSGNRLASIRIIPHLLRDPMKAEDIDTESVDHAADETRYAGMPRPWLKTPSLEERIKALPLDYVQKQVGTSEWEKHWKAYL
jgi:hypothetical protein